MITSTSELSFRLLSLSLVSSPTIRSANDHDKHQYNYMNDFQSLVIINPWSGVQVCKDYGGFQELGSPIRACPQEWGRENHGDHSNHNRCGDHYTHKALQWHEYVVGFLTRLSAGKSS